MHIINGYESIKQAIHSGSEAFMNTDPPGGLVTAQVAGPTASFRRPGVGPKGLHF